MSIKVGIEKKEWDKYDYQDFDDTVYYHIEDRCRDDEYGYFTQYVYGRITKRYHVRVIHQNGRFNIKVNELRGIEPKLSKLARILQGPERAKWFDIHFKNTLFDLGVLDE